MFLRNVKIVHIFVLFVLPIFILSLGGVYASAQTTFTSKLIQEPKLNSKSKKETDKILKILKDKDPNKLESLQLNKKSDKTKNVLDQNTLVSNQNELYIETELKTKKVKIKNVDKGETNINLPSNNQLSEKIDSVDIVDNKIIYSGKNSPVDTIIEAVDGGVRQILSIKDSTSPNFYDFKIDLEKGDILELDPASGGAYVKSSQLDEISMQPKIKTFILKPWAKDANNKDINTYYSVINGNTLRQYIDLKGATFPVVADPTWCSSFVSSTEWKWINIYSNQYNWSLEVRPTNCGMSYAKFDHNSSWSEVYRKTSSYGYIGYNIYYIWDKKNNLSSMQNQYYCHADWVQVANFVNLYTYNLENYRSAYHLELWRGDKGYWGFVWDKCN